jgi:hypothetical protein
VNWADENLEGSLACVQGQIVVRYYPQGWQRYMNQYRLFERPIGDVFSDSQHILGFQKYYEGFAEIGV